MLKKIRLLFLGFVVIAGSACVTPTHASSAHSVVISYVQAAGTFGAKDELVVIYNNSPAEVDITDWCLINKASVAFACFSIDDAPGVKTHFILPGYSSATIASFEFMGSRAIAGEMMSLVYEVTNQSSGSLVGSSEVLSLVNTQGESVDTHAWASAPPAGKAWSRFKIMSTPDIYAATGAPNDWSHIAYLEFPLHGIELRVMEDDGEDEPPEEPPVQNEASPIRITELLPNAAGADTGKEFIEFHNPDTTMTHSLDGLKLKVGEQSPKWYDVPSGISIAPNGYVTFSDTDLGFTLPNTSGSVQLYQDDVPLGDPVLYTSPKDDESWALIEGEWQFTAVATPGALNKATSKPITTPATSKVAEQKPCASNQFRNPETGRCKLIATTTSTSTACKPGQERNPETNRCRNIAVEKEPTPCKEGQERNPETNRCRNIVKMSSAEHGVKGIQEKAGTQLSWYYWVAIAGIVAAILGYAVWEWRQELANGWSKVQRMFAKK